ncbi:MAG: glycosyltransferase family 9 protein [Afipia sp.]|nr:glycosyltransferase family 9 protein [Afipia sp.]
MVNWRKMAASLQRRRDRPHLALLSWRGRRRPRDASRILVVRLDNIGDFVLWLDGARAIRHRYPRPDHRITLAASAEVAAFAASSGLFDEVIAVDRRRLGSDAPYRRALWRQIAGLQAAVAVNPTFSRALMGDELIHASAAPERIGLRGDTSNQTLRKKTRTDRWYTRLVDVPEGLHEIDINAVFARPFDAATHAMRPRLENAMLSRPAWLDDMRDYVVVFPSAGLTAKQWPPERFAAVIDHIRAQTGWSTLLCGHTSDADIAADIMRRTGADRVHNMCGQTTLNELAGVLASAKLLVANDTGAVHIAAAVGCPAVVPFGGWHFGRFLPYPAHVDPPPAGVQPVFVPMDCYQCDARCIFPRAPDDPFACLDRVSTEAVWEAVRPIIERA